MQSFPRMLVAASVLLGAAGAEVRAQTTRQEFSSKPLTSHGEGSATVKNTVSVSSIASQIYSHGDPTAEEQLMLELANRARANPSAEAARYNIDLNEGITSDPISPDPKQPLAFNVHIIQAARAHSQWMLDNDIFAHVETNGDDPGDRIQAAGYVLSGSWTWGENIATTGSTGPTPPVNTAVVELHQGLFVDEGIEGRGHRVDLMNPNFREIGIGVETGVFTTGGDDYNSVMATQDFGATGANPGPFLLGVVYSDDDHDQAYSAGEGLAGVTVTPSKGTYYAISSSSGGYAFPITGLSGILQVTFSGGSLAAPVTKSISLTGKNVKLDFEANADASAVFGFAAGSLKFSPSGTFEADLQGPPNAQLNVEVSDNLSQWTPAGSVVLTGTSGHFSDTPASGNAHRFYRLIKQ